MANKNKMKLIKHTEGTEGPQYSLTYKANLKNQASYTILSALIETRDVVMTMNTDIMFGLDKKEKAYFEGFLERVSAKGLAYCDRKVPSAKGFAILGLPINRRKKEEAREIAVYIPNAVWRQEDFGGVLPAYGARYYVAKEPMDPDETVEQILNMTEEERADVFVMDMYDISSLGQIGLNAPGMEEEALKRILGLS